MNDRMKMDAFGRYNGEPVFKVETQVPGEHADGSGARAVVAMVTVGEDVVEELKVGVHGAILDRVECRTWNAGVGHVGLRAARGCRSGIRCME